MLDNDDDDDDDGNVVFITYSSFFLIVVGAPVAMMRCFHCRRLLLFVLFLGIFEKSFLYHTHKSQLAFSFSVFLLFL